MADSTERQIKEPELQKFDAIINQSSVIEKGTPTRYRLKLRTESHDPSEPYTESHDPSEPYTESHDPSEPYTESRDPSEPYTESRDPSEPYTESRDPSEPYTESRDPSEPYTESRDPSEPYTESRDPSEPYTESRDPSEPYTESRDPSEPYTESRDPSEPYTESRDPSEPYTESRDPSEPYTESRDPSEPYTESRDPSEPYTESRDPSEPYTESRDPSEPYKKSTFGERDTNKPHKTILMLGETGIGKTTLINVMINYILGVKREDKVWFEITDDQNNRSSVQSQTSIITVYGFYLQESPIHLTIIDTPGYGDTRDIQNDKEIAESLLSLYKSKEEIHEIDAVCLVIKATQTRLSDRQIYIFDAVQSLFGRDIAENMVLLFTHSRGAIPKNVLTAVKEAKVKCAVDDKNQPVYFLFNNCQSDAADEGNEIMEQSWNLSSREITGFFKFLDTITPKTSKMTQDVLQKQRQLEENISKIKSRIQKMDAKQNELKETQEALKQHKKVVEENKNFEYEVEVEYKEKADIDPAVASKATCCSVCEENCHYPGCWWFSPLSWFSVMKDDHCTVCTNKCHYSKHVKEAKIYVTKTKTEKRIYEDLKSKYDDNMMKIKDGETLVQKLKEELQELEKEKIKLVMEAFHCVNSLEMIALNTDSLLILLHIDFLIEKLKEINEPEKAETLENIKKRAGEEKNKVLEYMKRCVKSENLKSALLQCPPVI